MLSLIHICNNSDTIGNAFGYQSRTLILDGIMYSFDEANMTYTATPAAENADPSTTYNYTNMQYSSCLLYTSHNGQKQGDIPYLHKYW